MQQGLWIFLGIVAGILVNIVVDFIRNKLKKYVVRESIQYELEYCANKSDTWVEYTDELKSKLLERRIDEFHRWFDLSKVIYLNMQNAVTSGDLYDLFSKEDLHELNTILTDYSPEMENHVNGVFMDQLKGADMGQKEKLSRIDFWKGKFKNNSKKLHDLATKVYEKNKPNFFMKALLKLSR